MRPCELPPDPDLLQWLDRQARQVCDPVARLRYLRQALDCPQTIITERRPRAVLMPIVVSLLLLASPAPTGSGAAAPAWHPTPLTAPARQAAPLWLVERTDAFEQYSNGLRVERDFLAAGELRRPRWAPRHEQDGAQPPDPAGIVFHASENDPAPFSPEQNVRLKREGRALLAWVRQHRLYHYLVDRFGVVHRILEDEQRAHHAGQSLWADGRWIYLDLNESFLGVCFEASTTGPEPPELSPAQLRAGRALLEMLRARYRIAAENCVTHAQVSINPANRRIGYHTDWADGFPFAELGLPDNYARLLPSMLLFGFEADDLYARRAGARLREALELGRLEVARQAQAGGLSLARYRRWQQERYRQACLRCRGVKESSP